jgi:hypothetical protein
MRLLIRGWSDNLRHRATPSNGTNAEVLGLAVLPARLARADGTVLQRLPEGGRIDVGPVTGREVDETTVVGEVVAEALPGRLSNLAGETSPP